MLTEAQNRLLTGVAPGTPMGELLRRYWMPIGAASEFESRAARSVRLMGEDLALYRDLSGNYGLVDRHCAHRRADLARGSAEPNGIRCHYHGWLFDAQGRCLEQPFDDTVALNSRYKDRIRLKAYPVREKGGLLWAYLGPEPAPELPDWEPFSWKNGFVQIVFADVPCNWFQCQENSIDPVHFEWMHLNWGGRLRGETGYAPKHLKIAFEEFEHGLVYKRVTEDTSEQHPLWTVGRVCLWPNGFYLGDHFEWRVPVDDTNTLSIAWMFSRVPNEREPYEQQSIPHWSGPVKDAKGEWISSHVMNQDFVAWVGQGTIADRTREHLAASDKGIVMMRQRFLRDLEAIARGEDPKGILRDPARNVRVPLPVGSREFYLNGLPRAKMCRHPAFGRHLLEYPFQVGQPAHVRAAYLEAMGFTDSELTELAAEEVRGGLAQTTP
jgi:5,5'-dehydrodivanillate O-demethylase